MTVELDRDSSACHFLTVLTTEVNSIAFRNIALPNAFHRYFIYFTFKFHLKRIINCILVLCLVMNSIAMKLNFFAGF